MKTDLYRRASLALIAAVVVIAGGVTAGAQTLSRTETVSDVEPAAVRADAGPGAEAAALVSPAEAQAAADQAAREVAYFERLEQEASYFKALEEQAYFAALEKQAAAAVRPAGVPDDSYWDRMATCETGGNWSMSGSRFSGGVGFANTTWNAWGGREFAANAGSATRDQQIVVANRVATQGYGNVAPVGYSGWGCARHSVGYP